MPDKNPIEERIDRLTDRWISFTEDSEARLLRWKKDDNNKQLIDTFLSYEQDEAGNVPDLFIQLDAAFETPSTYGHELLDQLKQGYSEHQDDIEEAGVDAGWTCPEPKEEETDCAAFMRACRSLYEYYADLMDYLAIVLTPTEISDDIDWQAWLIRLLKQPIPEQVRILVLDPAADPRLDSLCEMAPALTTTGYPDLNVNDAMEEITKSTNDGSAEGRFRELLASINKAAQDDEVERAVDLSATAVSLARDEEWWDMEATVYMLVAGIQLSHEHSQLARKNYRKGREAAKKLDEEHPSRAMLRLQSFLAEGGVLFKEKQYDEAASVYETAGPLADEADNEYLQIEAWRMAGTCYEELSRDEDAFRTHGNALDAAEGLEADDRLNSTVTYAGQSLMDLTGRLEYRNLRPVVEQRLEKLLGDDWREHLPEETA